MSGAGTVWNEENPIGGIEPMDAPLLPASDIGSAYVNDPAIDHGP